MPDIAAQRPAAGAPIESAWGAQVHDAVEGIQHGTVSITVSTGAVGTSVVTFPRPYAVKPNATAIAEIGISAKPSVAITGITATTLQLSISRGDGVASGNVTVHWIAIGTLA